jgi:transcriptional regulator with XRE-family HTH domain
MTDTHPNWFLPEMPPLSYTELLVSYRHRAELTQELVAKAMGISKAVLGGYERGARIVTWPMLVRLIDFYNLDPSEQYELFDAVLVAVRQGVAA